MLQASVMRTKQETRNAHTLTMAAARLARIHAAGAVTRGVTPTEHLIARLYADTAGAPIAALEWRQIYFAMLARAAALRHEYQHHPGGRWLAVPEQPGVYITAAPKPPKHSAP